VKPIEDDEPVSGLIVTSELAGVPANVVKP
jgi:hypothetical protein